MYYNSSLLNCDTVGFPDDFPVVDAEEAINRTGTSSFQKRLVSAR